MRQVFAVAATKGWAWCNLNAERTAALRNLKLLVGSGCLESPRGMAGMDSWKIFSSYCIQEQVITPGYLLSVSTLLSGLSTELINVYLHPDKVLPLLLPRWRCSSWIVTPKSIFHPYGLSDLFMSWMSLQNKRAGMDSWNKRVQQIFFRQCITFLWTWTAERLAAPKT